MAVLRPLKVVLTNYPEDQVEMLEAVNNPEDANAGSRQIPFTRELYIERDDFMEEAPKKFFRLKPAGEVRLRYGYIIKCEQVVKDPDSGEITELLCTYDPDTRSGEEGGQRKVKGVIHWVSATQSIEAEVRLYDRLFQSEDPEDNEAGKTFLDNMNPHSLETIRAKLEPTLKDAIGGERLQFERNGYFCVDTVDSTPGRPVFNRIVPLRDSWAKMQAKGAAD
jgi:glutaminyl-tRNA synthetase